MQEGALTGHEIADRTRKQSIFDPAVFWETYKNFNHYRPLRLNDKYKHAMMNCLASQRGTGALLGIDILSRLKVEIYIKYYSFVSIFDERIQSSPLKCLKCFLPSHIKYSFMNKKIIQSMTNVNI